MKQEIICVQKFLPIHNNELEQIHKLTDEEERKRLAAAFYTKKLWSPNTTITMKFLEDNPRITITPLTNMDTKNGPVDTLQMEFSKSDNLNIPQAIKTIVQQRIIPLVSGTLNLKFVDKKAPADVRISFDSGGGSWSLVGTDCLEEKNEPTMNFGWFDVATVIHEFGHMLGLIHEHQNPRGETIQWDKEAVYKWANETQGWDKETTQKNIIDKYNVENINGSDFDPLSIMLYFFPPSLTLNRVGTNQNLRLSGIDIQYIVGTYHKLNSQEENQQESKQLFEQFYNQNIQDNIEKSQQLQHKLESGINWYIIIIVGLVIILIIFFIIIIRQNKNKS